MKKDTWRFTNECEINELALKQKIEYSTAFLLALTYNMYELGNIWIDQLIIASV